MTATYRTGESTLDELLEKVGKREGVSTKLLTIACAELADLRARALPQAIVDAVREYRACCLLTRSHDIATRPEHWMRRGLAGLRFIEAIEADYPAV